MAETPMEARRQGPVEESSDPGIRVDHTDPHQPEPPEPEANEPEPGEAEPVPGLSGAVPDAVGGPEAAAEEGMVADGPGTPDDSTGAAPDSGGRRIVLGARRGPIVAGALVGAAVLAYLGVAWLTSGRVADEITVAGVELGGLDRAEAVAALNRAHDDLGGVVRLRTDRSEQELDVPLADLGLELDAEAVADRLTGFTLDPAMIWTRLRGGGAQEADPGAQDSAAQPGLSAFGEKAGQKPKNAAIRFDGTSARVQESVNGTEVAATAAAAVRATWLTGQVDLPMADLEPSITTADAERAVQEQAVPALSGPLVVRVGEIDVPLEPGQFASGLSFSAQDGQLTLQVDGARLRKLVLAEGKEIGRAPVDAKIVVTEGEPTVISGRDGLTIRAADVAEQVGGALLAAGDDRVAEVPTAAQKPDLTTAEARKLGVKERISTFSTVLTADPLRTENLQIAARTVDGTLVLPGETFSLNETLGERTAAKGYNPAPAISGGRLVQDYGGGVSQMATTIFNNVFFAGLEDVYHKPHSFYISRYPEGREATVNWPTVDLTWKNDSNTAVLIKASVGTQVTVSFYGTKHWDITAGLGARTNERTPQTVYDDSPGCVAQSANPGFDVSVTRTFRHLDSDAVVRTETFHSVYIAEDQVICGPEPSTDTAGDSTDNEKSDQGDHDDPDDQDDQDDQQDNGAKGNRVGQGEDG